jgi:hypothetical protein
MRDLIWTLIIVWLTWQIINIFRGSAPKRQRPNFQNPGNAESPTISRRQQKLDTEGEYVDFEESK